MPQLYSMECNAPAARNSDAAWFMVEVGLVPTAPVRTAAPAAVEMPMWSASTAPESESPLSESLAQLDVDETETWAGPACGGTGMTCGCGCWWCICGACGYACGCATGACGYACGWCATGALLTAGAAERSVGGEGREEGETRSGGGRWDVRRVVAVRPPRLNAQTRPRTRWRHVAVRRGRRRVHHGGAYGARSLLDHGRRRERRAHLGVWRRGEGVSW